MSAPPVSQGERIFSAATHVGHILRFEAALARAEARAGIIPDEAARAINETCRVELFDVAALERDALHAGTLAIPLVQQLIAHVSVTARPYVHWGATSQDAIDTALVLQMREGLEILLRDLVGAGDTLATLAESHRVTVMPGRTLLQQAVPITFGLKAARWLGAVTRQIVTLRALRADALVLQFGGAAGTLAALGTHGSQVAELLAAELSLPLPDLPWHAERDRPARVVSTLGVTAGVIAKIARDLVLLAQTEVAEVAEGAASGKGMSSAMPQKRNPVDATNAIAAAQLAIGTVPVVLSAMSQEHERGAGGWQTEWTAIPDAFRHTMRAALNLRCALTALDVRIDRMRVNLEEASGALMAESLSTALAAHVGRPEAMRLTSHVVEQAFHARMTLREAVNRDPRVSTLLSGHELDRALDPAAYLGSTNALIDRSLRSWREVREVSGGMIRGAVVDTGLAYRVDGPKDRPAVVFINALGTDHRLWDRQMPAVEGRFRVVRYEACGHGVSDPPRGLVTIERLGLDVIALLDHLDIERAVVCGCSLGGVIALWLSVNRPERVAGAVLANSGAKLGTNESWDARIAAVRAGGTAAVRDQVVGRFLTPEFRARDPETTALIAGMIDATNPDGYIAACEALRATDLRADATRVRVPVLIVGSERDESTPPVLSRELHASIEGSELVMIANAAHLSNVEQPMLFNEALLSFLAHVPPLLQSRAANE